MLPHKNGEEGFTYCKNAYKTVTNPPQSLIIAYMRSGQTAEHFLTMQELETLAKESIEKGQTYEACLEMAHVYDLMNNKKETIYWTGQAKKAEKANFHTPIIIPDLFKKSTPDTSANIEN